MELIIFIFHFGPSSLNSNYMAIHFGYLKKKQKSNLGRGIKEPIVFFLQVE